ncbi:hypothetical protein [Candidatus Nitrospira bockiana]
MATAVKAPAKGLTDDEALDARQLTSPTGCWRCGGLMVVEDYVEFPVWRCVQCGEMIDPVILRNRRQSSL